MIEASYEDLDIRSLRLLDVLLTECSVSRTAEILNKAQPSVSSSLKRLREMLGDPLLVRSGRQLVLTERGRAVRTSVATVLRDVERLLDIDGRFEPTASERRLRIAASDWFTGLLLPPLIERLQAEAPGMTLEFIVPPPMRDLLAGLENGDIDAVIGDWPELPDSLRCTPLLEADYVCVVRAGHPLADAGRIDADEYLACRHLSPTPASQACFSPVEGRLAQLGSRRRIAVSLPGFSLVPSVLAASDLVFTTARPFGEQVARQIDGVMLEAPDAFGTMNLHLLWHERAHHSAMNRWLRGVVAAVVGTLVPRRRSLGRRPLGRSPEQPAASM